MFILGRIHVGPIGDPVPPLKLPQQPSPPYNPATGESLLHAPNQPDNVLVRVPRKRIVRPPTQDELISFPKEKKIKKKKK